MGRMSYHLHIQEFDNFHSDFERSNNFHTRNLHSTSPYSGSSNLLEYILYRK